MTFAASSIGVTFHPWVPALAAGLLAVALFAYWRTSPSVEGRRRTLLIAVRAGVLRNERLAMLGGVVSAIMHDVAQPVGVIHMDASRLGEVVPALHAWERAYGDSVTEGGQEPGAPRSRVSLTTVAVLRLTHQRRSTGPHTR